MSERIPQSTTKRVLLKLYLTSDHITEATGKTVGVTISKNGGAFANPSAGVTNATEIGNGWYYVDLSTTDAATLGPLVVRGTATSCDNSEIAFTVANDNAGLKLAADGLALIIPAEPTTKPVFGVADIGTWIGYFGLWSVAEVDSDSDSIDLRNVADSSTVATHATSDDGTTFVNGKAT